MKKMMCLVSVVTFGLLAQIGRGAGRRHHQRPDHRRQRHGDRARARSSSAAARSCRSPPARRHRRACKTIDAKGMTAMPGFIDAHRHINTGPNEKAQMQALLEAGYTTILSGGGPADGNITLRDHIEKGVDQRTARSSRRAASRCANNTPETARAEIRTMAAHGRQVHRRDRADAGAGSERPRKSRCSRRSSTKAKKVGVLVQVHAVSSSAMMAAVDAGVRLLVHLPNKDWRQQGRREEARRRRREDLATIGFGAPVFGVFADDNKPRFRDGKPWPESIVDGVRLGEEAGYTTVNARTVWDAGVDRSATAPTRPTTRWPGSSTS